MAKKSYVLYSLASHSFFVSVIFYATFLSPLCGVDGGRPTSVQSHVQVKLVLHFAC